MGCFRSRSARRRRSAASWGPTPLAIADSIMRRPRSKISGLGARGGVITRHPRVRWPAGVAGLASSSARFPSRTAGSGSVASIQAKSANNPGEGAAATPRRRTSRPRRAPSRQRPAPSRGAGRPPSSRDAGARTPRAPDRLGRAPRRAEDAGERLPRVDVVREIRDRVPQPRLGEGERGRLPRGSGIRERSSRTRCPGGRRARGARATRCRASALLEDRAPGERDETRPRARPRRARAAAAIGDPHREQEPDAGRQRPGRLVRVALRRDLRTRLPEPAGGHEQPEEREHEEERTRASARGRASRARARSRRRRAPLPPTTRRTAGSSRCTRPAPDAAGRGRRARTS